MSLPRALPPVAVGTLIGLGLVKLLVHLLAINQYGYFRDELYYLASTDHLHWGYVDHPPLSIAILAVVRASLGDSLFALRIVAVMAGVATVVVTGLIARELGGGRFAQALAALAALAAPTFLGTAGIYSMNTFDVLCWAVATWVLLRALDDGRTRWWLMLGLVLGLGLLNKISVMWFAGGLAVGVLLTQYRRVVLQRGPWIAAAIAGGLFLPYILWQINNGWPTLEFMRNATSMKMLAISPVTFLIDQVLSMNVGAAPVWMTGIFFGLLSRGDARGRVLVWIYVAVLALLLAAGSARASYLAPAYCGLFALGAVALERFSTTARRTWIRAVAAGLIVAGGVITAPLALPVLPIDTFIRYQAALGMAPRTEERHEMGALPQHYADMFGWEEMTALVAEAYSRLTPEERTRCRVFGQNYGEAGAIDVLGRAYGLPPALSGHNSYWLWGPPDATSDVFIIIGGDRDDNAEYFEDIEIVGQTSHPLAMPYERGLDVSIGRRPKVDIRAAWPKLKNYN